MTYAPTHLRVDLRRAPYGIANNPTLAWRLPTGTVQQTAYRLRLHHGTETVTDSGWIASAACTGLTFPQNFLPLEPGTLYAFSVAVRGTDGNESPFSEPCAFSTAPRLSYRERTAIRCSEDSPFAIVRTCFSLTDEEYAGLDALLVTATARSPEPARQFVYTLYSNGQSVGVGPSRYGRDAAGRILLYTHTYNITALACAGDNTIGAILYSPAPDRAFLCLAVAHFKDGTSRVMTAPERWFALDGNAVFRPGHSIGTPYFTAHACNMDARAYPQGFSLPNFDASGWSPCRAAGEITDGGLTLTPAGCDPVERIPYIGHSSVTPLGEGHYVIDLGAEIVGAVGICVPDFEGTSAEVRVLFGEQLEADGTVRWEMQTGNRYVEDWMLTPGAHFETVDLMAYRFIEIQNAPFAVTPETFYGVEIRHAFEGDGASFDSDNALLNDLYTLTRRTVEATTQDIYVDSQSRERGAYEGDLLINLLASYAHECDHAAGRFSIEYLATHRTWPAEYILLLPVAAWEDYMATGDASLLFKLYPFLREKQFTRYLDSEAGLLHSGNAGDSGTDAILVDWPPSERDGYDMSVRFHTVLNCVAAIGYEALANIARTVGRYADSASFAHLAMRLREAIITRLYNPDTGDVSDGLYADGTPSPHVSQHAMAYALYARIFDHDTASRVADRLWERSLDSQGRGCIRMSVYGAYFLLTGLYRALRGDLANALLLDDRDAEGDRTWAYMLHRSVGEYSERPMGATLTTEAWNSRSKPNMTFSHPWGAAPAPAIVRGIFGIEPLLPGYERFTVRPQPHGIGRAAITVPTVRGAIGVSFTCHGRHIRAEITVPSGSEAVVIHIDRETILSAGTHTLIL